MTHRRNLVIGLLLASGMLAATSPALAHQPSDCGPMEGHGQFREQRAERMAQHQKRLHDALKLTAEQEPAWKKFTEAMHPMAPAERGNPADWAKLTAPERAEKMLELSKQRQERMAEHVAALKTFYAVLTPEQKKVFDEQHAGMHSGRRGMPAGGNAAPAKS